MKAKEIATEFIKIKNYYTKFEVQDQRLKNERDNIVKKFHRMLLDYCVLHYKSNKMLQFFTQA